MVNSVCDLPHRAPSGVGERLPFHDDTLEVVVAGDRRGGHQPWFETNSHTFAASQGLQLASRAIRCPERYVCLVGLLVRNQ